VHRGHRAYRQAMEAGIEEMDLKFEHEEVSDGDRLLVAGRYLGRGTSSGVPVDQPVFSVLNMRRGLVIRREDFTDRDKALKAAGLRE
jgi:ketosteroid isomerase-like protein